MIDLNEQENLITQVQSNRKAQKEVDAYGQEVTELGVWSGKCEWRYQSTARAGYLGIVLRASVC